MTRRTTWHPRGMHWCMLALALLTTPALASDDVEHYYTDSDGVRIHYAAVGAGPLIVFVHGFPDFWYSWRHQMAGLRDAYRVVALDTRGYNLSDQPEHQDAYDLELLIHDVAAVIEAEGRERAVVVGHDWGGAIAWGFAAMRPEMTAGLVILNAPHPRALARELAHNPTQQASAQYARDFRQPDSHEHLDVPTLAALVGRDEPTRTRYREAFEQSSLSGMMNYYRQNYPPYEGRLAELPDVAAPVLQVHGLQDEFIHSDVLEGTWDWAGAGYTLVTLPDAGHWPHHDAPDQVTATIRGWLAMHSPR